MLMRCPRCNKRIGFNERGNICPRCGQWLLSRPPSEHMLEQMERDARKDEFINDFPWIGGKPGRRAMRFTAIWVVALVALALLILMCFITRHFVIAIVLVFVTACVGVLPSLALVGSRI
jgi:hypothetical protein